LVILVQGRKFVANRTVTKRELCETIAERAEQPQALTRDIVQLFLDVVTEKIADGNRLELRNFGVFDTRLQKRRKGRNPRTNEVVHVDPKAVVTFKAGKAMREKAQHVLPQLQQEQEDD
jgi:nucleoid DNA-binding protein